MLDYWSIGENIVLEKKTKIAAYDSWLWENNTERDTLTADVMYFMYISYNIVFGKWWLNSKALGY